MERRYQVFVSSTHDDLREERQEVMQALLELDCIPSGMELFPAADEDQWTLIKKVIDDCDYYLVIIAGRYGSIGPEGKSYTQMEYEYAISTGKPTIAFLHADPGKIQASKTDPQNHEKLELFRDLARKKMCKPWSSAHELGSVVSRSTVRLIKEHPAVGWVRATYLPDESAAQEILKLRKIIDELQSALKATESSPPSGVEWLAQGSDVLTIRYQCVLLTISSTLGGGVSRLETISATWDDIFSVLGPTMIDHASEAEMRQTLQRFFSLRREDEIKKAGNFELDRSSVFIVEEDFQKIKLQLRALGLIAMDARFKVLSAVGATHWQLTPYGERVVLQVAAVRRARE